MKKVVSIFILFALVASFSLVAVGGVEAASIKITPKTKVVAAKKVVKKVVKKKVTKRKKIVVGREPILSAPLLAPDPAFYSTKK